MLLDLVRTSRSYRRFDQSVPVAMQDLIDLVELARLCPSAANKQPLRFILCTNAADNARIFSCLKWAAALPDWDGPQPGEQPSAYIIIINTAKSWEYAKHDQGIMAQTMMLGAVEKGLGGCILASVDRTRLASILKLQDEQEICLILALGKPVEEVQVLPAADGSVTYYRDEKGTHYVPKRSLDELILKKIT